MASPLLLLVVSVLGGPPAMPQRTAEGRYLQPDVQGRIKAIKLKDLQEVRVEFKLTSQRRKVSPMKIWRTTVEAPMSSWYAAIKSASQKSPFMVDPNKVYQDSDDIAFVHYGGWVVTFRVTDPAKIADVYGVKVAKLYFAAMKSEFPGKPGRL